MRDNMQVVKTLLDALPFIKKFANEKIVIKYGGAAQTSAELKEQFAQVIPMIGNIICFFSPVILYLYMPITIVFH